MKKLFEIFLCILIAFVMHISFVSADNILADKPSEWAKDEIEKAELAQIVYTDKLNNYNLLNNYRKNITREEFCALITELYTAVIYSDKYEDISFVPYSSVPFSDTTSQDVFTAYRMGFLKGVSSDQCEPSRDITREEISVMLKRMMDGIGYTTTTADLSKFSDYDQISPWALESLSVLYNYDIFAQISGNQILPQSCTTREEAISIAWRIYKLLTDKDILIYSETTPDILIELGIVNETDWDKSPYITIREAFETINKATKTTPSDNISDWYVGYTLSPMDSLSDYDKALLLSLSDFKYNIISYDDILKLNLNSNISNFEAIKYITRMVDDTYSCMDTIESIRYTERSQFYQKAYDKKLINSFYTENADAPILRSDFYQLIHKAIFVVVHHGGESPYSQRYIDKKEYIPPQYKKTIITDVDVKPENVTIHDDFSVSWDLPEEYAYLSGKDYSLNIDIITPNKKESTYIRQTNNNLLDGKFILLELITNHPENIIALDCIYYKTTGTREEGFIKNQYHINIDFPDYELITEGKPPSPGTYTENYASPGPYTINITLGENDVFEKNAYYIFTGYEHTYRKEEYNDISYDILRAEETSNSIDVSDGYFGAFYPDDTRIQKVIVTGNPQTGFTLYATPQSKKSFTYKAILE